MIFIFAWKKWNSTPGKMLFGIKIVDEKTMKEPSTGQCLLRFLGYIVSTFTLFIGFLMIGFNKRKKGLHDYIAGTIVIYSKPLDPAWEKKKLKYQTYFMLSTLIILIIYFGNK